MREIKFRGKTKMAMVDLDILEIPHVNGWVYGNLITEGEIAFIVGGIEEWDNEYLAHSWWVMVDEDTIGQYTGLKDRYGTDIYEGDIVNCDECYGKIEWNEEYASFCLLIPYNDGNDVSFDEEMLYDYADECRVIGNIYENPELLEVN